MEIRSSTAADLGLVYQIGLSAFSVFDVFGPPWFDDAAILPAKLAALPEFDPALLRLVGESGYALWMRWDLRVGGNRTLRAWNLAPLAVRVEDQRRGIGSALTRDGIALAREDGADLICIWGHPSYYPRFGLKPGHLGRQGPMTPLPGPGTHPCLAEDCGLGKTWRPPRPSDESLLLDLWLMTHGQDPGWVVPGSGLAPWISATRGIHALVWAPGGEAQGWLRLDTRPGSVPEDRILGWAARDRESLDQLLAYAREQLPGGGELCLPAGPNACARLGLVGLRMHRASLDGGMIMPLRDDLVLPEGSFPWNMGLSAAYDF